MKPRGSSHFMSTENPSSLALYVLNFKQTQVLLLVEMMLMRYSRGISKQYEQYTKLSNHSNL